MIHKALVTGGAGFIGSHLVKTLLDQGCSVTCVDNESSEGHDVFQWDKRAKNLRTDINDLSVADFQDIDVVFHMAAEVSIPRCIADPKKTFHSNVSGTFHVLNCSKEAGVKRLVFSSTSSVYGMGGVEGIKQDETDEVDPLNIYATSKLMCEQLCKLAYKQTNGRMSTVCLRYFNVYGEGQSNKGQYCPVVAVFRKQKTDGVSLTVVGDGKQTRDYVHVMDVVNANILAANTQAEFEGTVFNIGTGKAYSVMDIAHKIAGSTGTIKFLPKRSGEALHTLCNYEKASNAIGWVPTIDLMKWLDKT